MKVPDRARRPVAGDAERAGFYAKAQRIAPAAMTKAQRQAKEM